MNRSSAEKLLNMSFPQREAILKGHSFRLKHRNPKTGTETWLDPQGNETLYISKNATWTLTQWVQLSNGKWKVARVDLSYGYWREHHYDIDRCRLISEIDLKGNTNLLYKRLDFDSTDTEISEEQS